MKKDRFPLWPTIISAFVAIFGYLYNNYQSINLETKKFESDLILKSINPNDSAQSIKNIRFLIKAGFIDKNNEKVIGLIKDTVYHIVFPKKDTVVLSPQRDYKINFSNIQLFSAQILDENNHPLKDVEINIFENALYQKNNDKAYSTATSDSNGLFKIGLPSKATIKIVIIKKGYIPIYKLYQIRALKGLNKFVLEKQ